MYSTGTLGLTNGSTAVTGVGTAWVSNLRAGWLILIPGEGPQLVASVNSNTSITLARNYQGTTRTGVAYNAIPTGGVLSDVVAQLQALLGTVQDTVDGAGAGKFPSGTQALPGLRFTEDEDTGFRRAAANALAMVAGGVDRLTVSPSGAALVGLLTGTAVTQTPLDNTSGRLLKVGDGGLLGNAATYTGHLDSAPTGATVQSGSITEAAAIALGYPATPGHAGTTPRFFHVSTSGTVGRLIQDVTEIFGSGGGVTKGRTWRRVLHDTWHPFFRLLDINSLTSGANANGNWERLPSGLQVCWQTAEVVDCAQANGAIYRHSEALSWTFPAAFSAPPSVDVGGGANGRWGAPGAPSITACNYRIFATGADASTFAPRLIAIGPWAA